ncbi:glycosyltransferase family 4 protein [uncultured Zoogloea sp.]|uniref:glycosyltransferase family 4 protein n=1 Tax=uncultured Zoogloea sp. TaxID=160237 RepID=UPI00261F0122|nr:glycosyltransferase family 4 protein [uncultured Zoogloea sp.]
MTRNASVGACLIVASIFTPIQGGSATVYSNLCRYAPKGRMVALATRRDYNDGAEIAGWRAHDQNCGFPVYRLDLLRPRISRPAHKLIAAWRFLTIDVPLRLRVIWTVWKLIRRHGIEVICIGELASTAWLGEFFQRVFGKRMVIYVHGEEITTRFDAGSFGASRATHLRAADAVVAVSRFTQRVLVDEMGIAPDRVCLIENGVDTKRFSPGPDDPAFRARFGLAGKRIVVAVGRLIARKGFDQTIRAWPQVFAAHPDCHLLIIGDGPQRASLQALVDQSGVAHSITLAGALSDADLLSAYRSAALFAMPNRTMPDGDTEGFGLTFLEANACGRAVVGGRAGGAVEAVQDGVSGLLVNGERIDEIADAILRVLGDDAFRARLEAGALAHAQAHSWEHSVQIFQNLCERLQNKGGKHG